MQSSGVAAFHSIHYLYSIFWKTLEKNVKTQLMWMKWKVDPEAAAYSSEQLHRLVVVHSQVAQLKATQDKTLKRSIAGSCIEELSFGIALNIIELLLWLIKTTLMLILILPLIIMCLFFNWFDALQWCSYCSLKCFTYLLTDRFLIF